MKSLLPMIIMVFVTSFSYGFSLPDAISNDTLLITTLPTDETCNLDNGTITIEVLGDTTGVTYSIDQGLTYTSDPHFTGLSAGDYLIIARNNDCFAVESAQIEDLDGPQLSVSAECVPGRNKIALISDVESSIPVSYLWEGPNNIIHTDSIVMSTIPGTYHLTIIDDLGCISESSVTLEACCALELSCNLPPIVESCTNLAPDTNPLLLDPLAGTQDKIEALLAEGIAIDTGQCGMIRVEINDTPIIPTDCNDDLVINRLYTISDNETSFDCAQQINLSNHVTIESLRTAEDLNVACDSDFMEELQRWIDVSGGMSLNGCSEPYTYSTDPENITAADISCGETMEITFIATDVCGNSTSSTALFSISDTESPEIDCPEPTEVNPTDAQFLSNIEAWLESVEVTDNCSPNPASNDLDVATISTDCDDPAQLNIRFTTVDDCGNTADCTSRISIISPSAPTFNCTEDITISCDEDRITLIDEWINGVNAQNADGSPVPVSNDLDADGLMQLNCGESQAVLFSIIDDCDREVTCTNVITIIDQTDPEINCPPRLTIPTSDLDGSAAVTIWLESVEATDNCTSDLLVLNDMTQDFSDLCEMTGDTEVNFSVADDCGNEVDCETTVSIISSQPSINCPGELTITCGDPDAELLTTDWLSDISAEDNDNNDITHDFSTLSAVGCDEATIVEFITLNNCGADARCSSSIRVIDQENPEITCPQDLSVDIASTNLSAEIEQWLGLATAIDCNTTEIKNDFESGIVASLTCTEPFDILFEAEDLCGHTSSCSAILTIENSRPISITCPDRLEIQCSDSQLAFKIEQHMEQIRVESSNDYDITEILSEDLSSVTCLNANAIEIELVATDVCDEEDRCETGVDLLPDPEIYIPNVFTPNGDRSNDYFTAYGNESVDYIISMVIFNRWGSKIYESENIDINEDQQGWDGRYVDTQEQTQVFTYLIKIMDLFGNEIEKTGTVQIINE